MNVLEQRRDHEDAYDDQAQYDAIPTECSEVVALDIANEELDCEDGYDESSDTTRHQNSKLRAGKGKAVLQELHKTPPEHDGNGKIERELGGHATRDPQQHGTYDGGTATRGTGDDSQTLEQAYSQGLAQAHLGKTVDR